MKKILNIKWELFIAFITLIGSIFCFYTTYLIETVTSELFILRILIISLAPLTYVLFKSFRKCLKEEILSK